MFNMNLILADIDLAPGYWYTRSIAIVKRLLCGLISHDPMNQHKHISHTHTGAARSGAAAWLRQLLRLALPTAPALQPQTLAVIVC